MKRSVGIKTWLAVALLLGLGLTSIVVLAAGFSTSQKTAFNTGAGHVEPTEWATVSWNSGRWAWEAQMTPTPNVKAGVGLASDATALPSHNIAMRPVFNWGNSPDKLAFWAKNEVQYMVQAPKHCEDWDGPNSANYKQQVVNTALQYPGAIWVMFNEPWRAEVAPNYWAGEGGCFYGHTTLEASTTWAYTITHDAIALIKSVDPSAKIACCGLGEHQADQAWFNMWRTKYYSAYLEYPPLDFIHVHLYALRYWDANQEKPYPCFYGQGTCSNWIDWRVFRDMYQYDWYPWYQYTSGYYGKPVIVTETGRLLWDTRGMTHPEWYFTPVQNNCSSQADVCPDFNANPEKCLARCQLHPWMDWISAKPEIYGVMWFTTRYDAYYPFNAICADDNCVNLSAYLGATFQQCAPKWNDGIFQENASDAQHPLCKLFYP